MRIELAGVSVVYPSLTIGPISLDLGGGELHCLLGPNGAGKTSVLRAVLGLTRGVGVVRLNGKAMALGGKVLRQMAEWAPDGTDLMPEALTGWELMRFHAWCGISGCLHGQQAMLYAEELANRFALQPAPGQLTGSYSFGMKRKLQLICCLMRRPDFVIVDEPRNGLDPVTADEVAAVLQEHRQHGAVIVTATHDLDFAARESTHVAVLLRGMLKAVGSRDQVFADKDPRERYRELVSQ